MKLFSIRDLKANYYLPVFQARNVTEAVRHFTEIVVASDTPVSKYPSDFDLVEMGTFDIEKGVIIGHPAPGVVLNGLAALQASQAERKRYQEALSPQMDIEDITRSAERS